MALRYRQQGYPGSQIAPITYALANLGNAFLSGPSQFEVDKLGMETDKLKVERDKLRREFDATGRLGDVVGGQSYTPEQAAALRREAILAGRTGADMGNIGRVFTFQTSGADQPTRDRAFMAAGGSADNTETGHAQTLANRIQQANIGAGATITAANIAERGRMARRFDSPVMVNPGDAPFFIPEDPRFAGRTPGTVVTPKPMPPLTVNPGDGVFFDPSDPRAGSAAPGSVPVPKPLPPVLVTPGSAAFPDPSDPRMKGVAPGTVVAPKTFRDQNPSPIGRLIAERDALPPGDPRRAVYDEAIAKEAGTPEASAMRTRNAKVQDLVRTGVPADRAQALVDGLIEVKAEGGQWVEIDKRSGTVKVLRPDDPAVVAQVSGGVGPAPSAANTQRALSLVAGPVPSAARGVAAGPLGVVYNTVSGEGSIAPDTTSATSALQLLNNDLKRALQIGRSQKELDQIASMLPGPGFFRSPAGEMFKFDNIRRGLVQENELDAKRLAGSPLSATARTQIQKDMREREIAIGKMDDFVARFGGGQVDRPQTGTAPAVDTPAPAARPPMASRPDPEAIRAAYEKARKALQSGASRREVDQALRDMGIDPRGLR